MKKYWAVLLLAMASQGFADVPLQSSDEIQGSWKLEYTKKSASAQDTIKREDTWRSTPARSRLLISRATAPITTNRRSITKWKTAN
ncbi:hypothetical protein [Methylomonas koyamae]|uniref:hypothetical protein n=1 Tax=Methylomonas koyamae TaxID=702114 RepID=UPI000A4FA64D|nr:hypothetical protein [Methylomonas koyamae]